MLLAVSIMAIEGVSELPGYYYINKEVLNAIHQTSPVVVVVVSGLYPAEYKILWFSFCLLCYAPSRLLFCSIMLQNRPKNDGCKLVHCLLNCFVVFQREKLVLFLMQPNMYG